MGSRRTASDWLLPLAVLAAMVTFTIYMYRQDCAELRRSVAVLLTSLRLSALLALGIAYMQPQWRHEREEVTNCAPW